VKRCPKCNQEKDTSDFGRDKYKKSGYKSVCKVCLASASKRKRDENPERSREITKAYRTRNREKELLRYTRYNKTHPEVRAAHSAKRRAYRKNATPVWLTEEQKQNMACMYALAKKFERLCNVEYHVDHIVPLAGKGICGLHVPWNLQILEAKLNFSKGNSYNGQEFIRGRS
jgi:hypothetical protein